VTKVLEVIATVECKNCHHPVYFQKLLRSTCRPTLYQVLEGPWIAASDVGVIVWQQMFFVCTCYVISNVNS
jgi:hypothetical protein